MMNKFFPAGNIIFVALFLLYLVPVAQAQDIAVADDMPDGKTRLIRLAWMEDEHAFQYEVVIEKEDEDEGEYQWHLQEFTEDFSIEASLPPGKYRYGVISYDLLNRPTGNPEWNYFEILVTLAAAPEIEDSSPMMVTTDAVLEVESDPPPSPLVRLIESIEYYAGASWMPVFPLNGSAKRYLDGALYPAGAIARIGAISNQQGFISAGLELGVSWFYASGSYDGRQAELQLISIDPALVIQKRFFGQMMGVSLRFGAGITIQTGSVQKKHSTYGRWINEALFNDQNAHFLIGGSLFFVMPNNMYIEAGLDYPYQFSTSVPLDYLRPWIGAGLRF